MRRLLLIVSVFGAIAAACTATQGTTTVTSEATEGVITIEDSTGTLVAAGLGAFPIPAVGETVPARLYDGHLVFVTHDLDGTITVVEAVSTHLPDDPMGWCEKDRTIDDIAHSARWDVQGRYVGGPAATDLGTYQHTIDEQTDQITVLVHEPPEGKSTSPHNPGGDTCIGANNYTTHATDEDT